jgi:hypothetical protein
MERSLKTRPGERWQDADAFVEALNCALAVDAPGGTVTIPFPLGERPHLLELESGELDVSWVVGDPQE